MDSDRLVSTATIVIKIAKFITFFSFFVSFHWKYFSIFSSFVEALSRHENFKKKKFAERISMKLQDNNLDKHKSTSEFYIW